jgi:hypothetical protein
MAVIIVDKSVLRGGSALEWNAFCARHTPLIAHTLDYEIATEAFSDAPPWPVYFEKLRGVEFYICQPIRWLLVREVRTRRKTEDIINHEITARARRALAKNHHLRASELRVPGSYEFYEEREPEAYRDAIGKMWSNKFIDAVEKARAIMSDQHCSAADAYVQIIPEEKAEELWAIAPQGKETPPPYVLRRGWLNFNYARLRGYLIFYYRLMGNQPDRDLGNHVLANANLDLNYIVLLTCAEGIVSDDKHLIEISRAFFPTKLVWAGLREGIDWKPPA